MELRWYFVLMVTAAIAISYFDRQTLPVAISAIQRNIPISNQQFSYLQTAFLLSYAAMYVVVAPIYPILRIAFGKNMTTTEELGRAMLVAAKRADQKRVVESSQIAGLARG